MPSRTHADLKGKIVRIYLDGFRTARVTRVTSKKVTVQLFGTASPHGHAPYKGAKKALTFNHVHEVLWYGKYRPLEEWLG